MFQNFQVGFDVFKIATVHVDRDINLYEKSIRFGFYITLKKLIGQFFSSIFSKIYFGSRTRIA